MGLSFPLLGGGGAMRARKLGEPEGEDFKATLQKNEKRDEWESTTWHFLQSSRPVSHLCRTSVR